MSSSFVKDCSDVSAPGNSSSGKTVIIIVNNETGNVSLDQDELQNLLASHGADGSQVSVVRMGSGGVGGVIGNPGDIVTTPSIVATTDGTAHVNFTVEGYPTIPLEGQVTGGMNYAELPLDQDAFQRLESVLESEEAREILGEPLLNMVANPDQLGPLDQLMDSSLFDGTEQGDISDTEQVNSEGSSSSKKTRSPPKRRSQRQMDKAEREEVEKILAENKKLLLEEKQQLGEQQIVENMRKLHTHEEEEEEIEEEEMEEEESDDEEEEESENTASKKTAMGKKKGKLAGKGRGRVRGKGKSETEKEKPQETKGKGKGKKKIEEEEQEGGVGRGGGGRGKGRGTGKEGNTGSGRGRGRGTLKKDGDSGGVGKNSDYNTTEKTVGVVGRRKKTDVTDNDEERGKLVKAGKQSEIESVSEKSNENEDKKCQRDNTKGSEITKDGNKGNSEDKKGGKARKGIKGKDEGNVAKVDNVKSVEQKVDKKDKDDDSDGGKKLKLRKSVRGRGSCEENDMELESIGESEADLKKSQAENETDIEKKLRSNHGNKKSNEGSGFSKSENSARTKEVENVEAKENADLNKVRPRKGLKGSELGKNQEQESDLDKVKGVGRRKIMVRTMKKSSEGKSNENCEPVSSSEEAKETEDQGMEVDTGITTDENASEINAGSSGAKIKSVRLSMENLNMESALAKEMFSELDLCVKPSAVKHKRTLGQSKESEGPKSCSKSIADLSAEIFGDSDLPDFGMDIKDKNILPATPRLISDFQPPMSSTPNTESIVKKVESASETLLFDDRKINNEPKKLLRKKFISKELKVDSKVEEKDVLTTQVSAIGNVELKPLSKSEVVVVKSKVQKENLNANAVKDLGKDTEENARVSPEKVPNTEGRSRLIQVKSPVGIRQVVVLNSAKSAAKETLVKVIDPIDPPREEDRLTVAQICANAKKEAAMKRKLDQKKKTADVDDGSSEVAEFKGNSEAAKVSAKNIKNKGKSEKTLRTEFHKKEPPPKIVDLEMKLEDSVQLKKKEAQRKREEIQRKREEILRKREAIKLRKEQQMKEMMQMKREENHEPPEQENRVDKPVQKVKHISVSQKNTAAESLRSSNSQESVAKREVKVIVQTNKGHGLQRAESVEVLQKVKGQITSPKKPAIEAPQRNKVKLPSSKNESAPKKVVKKESAVTARTKKMEDRPKPLAAPLEESPVRRSGRAIKKKTFGDEMLTFDLKEEIVPEGGVESASEEEPESEEEDEDSIEDYDDPERLWCICQKPHNNRFMICCDRCEDWFHGTCVGISKAMGQQMEDERQEWVCPKCKKAEKALKSTGISLPQKKELVSVIDLVSTQTKGKLEVKSGTLNPSSEAKKVLSNEGKKEAQASQTPSKKVTQDGKKVENSSISSKSAETPVEDLDGDITEIPTASSSTSSSRISEEKPKDLEEHQIPGVTPAALKSEPRVLVYEKTTGKILSGSEAPSLREVKSWLKDNPNYAILHPGMMKASGAVVKAVKPDGSTSGADVSGQNKVIHVSTPSSQPPVKSTPQKLTVVKSADGRIIVKAAEALSKGFINTSAAVSKTGLVASNPKPVVVSTKGPAVKDAVKDTETKGVESDPRVLPSISESDELDDGNLDVAFVKKNNDNQLKGSVDNSPVKKNLENIQPGIDSSKVSETLKPSDSITFKSVDSLSAKAPDGSTKVTSPIKDMKKTPLKVPVVAEKKPNDPNIVRTNVKKTLAECLTKRSKEATNEFEDLTEENIYDLADEIEKELFMFFSKDVGFKYKSRYRSLLFNIRDTKNSGLFRKILNGTIPPANLAKMTSEELASKELAEWREREEKKELQAIEKHELDMISLGNQYIMKSHKGEIEIDKDEFIKDKEKAPETINALPTDPVMGLLADTSSGHKNHIYDMNCKLCTGKQDSSAVSQDLKYKGKYQDKKETKDDKKSDPEKLKDRKERKSSSDRDKDKERHRHRSRDHDKEKSKKHKRERSKEREKGDTKSKGKESGRERKDSEKDKYKHKDRKDSKDSERERHRSSDRKERRDSKEDKERKHKHKKDRRNSKEDKERKDGDRKRKHSESRSDDSKRRDSEKSKQKEDYVENEVESDKLEREKAVVSTSEDIVIDFQRLRHESFSNLDPDAKDSVPTSTVIGSPDIMELKDDGYSATGVDKRSESPGVYPVSPSSYTDYMPPLPGDEAPLPPPLPDSPPAPPYIDVPSSDSPSTPPLPDSLDSPKTPSLPDEICLSPSTIDEDDFPNTPPLPDDDIPATPPLPSEIDENLDYDKPSTPPLPFTKTSLPPRSSSSAENKDRLTPPLESVDNGGAGSSPVSTKSGEPIIVWKGAIHMTDVSKFYASAFEVSGKARFLPEDVPKVVEVVGRISPDTVWSYIAQTKKTGSKEILVVRFQPSNEEEKVSYIALYSYLSSKKRYGVIGNCEKEAVKDFYIVPLASHQPIPQVLLPLDGPGFEEHRAHMLIGVIIRAKHRRIYDHITGSWQIVGGVSSVQNNPLKSSELPERSYTPPLPTDQESEEILVPSTDSEDDTKFDERLTPPPKDVVVDSSSEFRTPGSHKRQSKGLSDFDQPKKRMSLDRRLQEVVDISTEPKSPAEFSFADGTLDQESMLAELNRQIEVHKKELSEMQKTVLNEEEEPYSPSMSNSASPGEEPLKLDTSKINIPSNLQEILNNIKEKELEIKNKELEIKRRLSLAADPIVMNYAKFQDAEAKSSSASKVPPSDVDLRPVLQHKPKEVEHKEDVDLRILHGRDPKNLAGNTDMFGKSDDTDLRVRDPRLARAHAAAVMEAIEKGKTLGTLTDEELLAKALEMEGKENSNKQAQMGAEMEPVFQPVPPPPFMAAAGPSGYMPPPGSLVPPHNPMPCPQPPGMVGMQFMNQVAQPPQPMGIYGPGGGRDQGIQGPSCMPGPQQSVHEPSPMGHHGISNPNAMGPPCGPPIHEPPGLPGCGPNPIEPPSRYGESSRYSEEGRWKRNYEDREWDYGYDHYPKDEHYRNTDRYRESDYYRDKDRDRDWRRRQDREGGYKRQHFRKKGKFDRGGSGDHERRRSKQHDRGGDGEDGGYERRRTKQFENRSGNSDSTSDGNYDRKRNRFSETSGRSKKKHERNRSWSNFENLHRANDDNRGPEDGDECPYEIDY
ncbi:death-inducer obliterator 1-like isoform X2 [Palaemon carinicauda]|uniref:death-inducer obliterator 1-like isoform X2 n=1 Tax=Palaemon carinicauda TaxID=392227 RepID=UPI0035B5E8F2